MYKPLRKDERTPANVRHHLLEMYKELNDEFDYVRDLQVELGKVLSWDLECALREHGPVQTVTPTEDW